MSLASLRYASYRPSISADGRYVVFWSLASDLVPGDTNGQMDIFVKDRYTGILERVNVGADGSQANDWTGIFTISGDGRFVAFEFTATNLVPGDTNGKIDIFIVDRSIPMQP
jgi:Tol biopolymer transport system component